MPLLGIELSDAGIMAAGGEPAQLLAVEGGEKESPGFALAHKDHLIIGKDAQTKARLNPRLYTNHFWDELNTEPLKQPGLEGKNNGELAYFHLAKLWDTIKRHGDELVMTVPGFFTQQQLSLLLGIANELSLPLKGFATTALAALSQPHPEHLLFHLDMHLHRIEITFLEQSNHLLQRDTKTLPGKGFNYLYAEWVKTIADEFVRTTRFDPFDQAIYEQELYLRLPQVLRELQMHSSTTFAMKPESQTYSVTLNYDLFAKTCGAVFREGAQLIREMAEHSGESALPIMLAVTHRINSLPGYREELEKIPSTQIIELEPGSGALGVLTLKDRFTAHTTNHGVSLLTSRPWQATQLSQESTIPSTDRDMTSPTHILYRSRAYPLSPKPLIIGQGTSDDISIRINDQVAGISPKHCTLRLSGDDVVLVNHSTWGTLVDGTTVSETALVKLGQTIRIGTPGEELRLITCVRTDET
jgi:hypothetical protein